MGDSYSAGTQDANVEAVVEQEDLRVWGAMNPIFLDDDVEVISLSAIGEALKLGHAHKLTTNE